MWITKVCIQRKPKLFSALALKFNKWGKYVTVKRERYVIDSFERAMFFLRDIMKIASDQ